MLAALNLARLILSLAPEAIALVRALVELARGHAPSTQRVVLDAAMAAAEDALARRITGRK